MTYKNMLRAVESMAVEMSFGIIFIGNGKLSTADFARFIESHKVRYDDRSEYFRDLHNVNMQLAEEYIYQSEGFLSSMRAILQVRYDYCRDFFCSSPQCCRLSRTPRSI